MIFCHSTLTKSDLVKVVNNMNMLHETPAMVIPMEYMLILSF